MKKNIVAIDDEYAIRYFYKVSLEKNYNIVTIKDGSEARKHLIENSNKIDLVILDLMLPGIDGFELLKEFKTKPISKNIPVIVVTAKHQDETIKKCKERGADGIVFKPFEPDILFKRIRDLLDSS